MTHVAKKPPSSWRDLYPVHPCADVFPMMSDEELNELANDITAHGLREPVLLHMDPQTKRLHVLDGRNRLEAITRAGIDLNSPPFPLFEPTRPEVDPATYVTSLNIHRRHLTKEQRAELIVKVFEAGRPKNDSAKVARSFNPTTGKKGGSTKDPVLEKAVTEAKKHGISPRTVIRARAKLQGKPTPPRKSQAVRKEQPVPPPPPVVAPTPVLAQPPVVETTLEHPEGLRELALTYLANTEHLVEQMLTENHRQGVLELLKDVHCQVLTGLEGMLNRLRVGRVLQVDQVDGGHGAHEALGLAGEA